MIATISADIVRSTSLQTEDLLVLRERLKRLLDDFEQSYPGFWARIVRGDSIECVVPEYRYSLRIAILIKLFVKILVDGFECHELLHRHGIRFSIGIADISYADKVEDIINGPAIYLSGRNLDEISRRDLFSAFEIEAVPAAFNDCMESYVALLSNLVDSYSAKQAEVVFYKLMGYKEVDISRRLGIYQSAVNMRSTSAQWGLLNTAIKDYEQLDFKELCG
jgi:hypothetical protein